MIKPDYPNAEYGIMTSFVSEEDIRSIIAKEYKTTKENVELDSNLEIMATVRTIVRYSDMEKK